MPPHPRPLYVRREESSVVKIQEQQPQRRFGLLRQVHEAYLLLDRHLQRSLHLVRYGQLHVVPALGADAPAARTLRARLSVRQLLKERILHAQLPHIFSKLLGAHLQKVHGLIHALSEY